ncbi:hypothetical protein AA0488_0038 [Kozakia baliensis NRIC 0488]|nr:hypothetical protein AA0488_0038 [Kozakia baliensis NRIC 0488]GEL65504.1 hypothetical protein KBA01_27900 [Kozakia baliensis]
MMKSRFSHDIPNKFLITLNNKQCIFEKNMTDLFLFNHTIDGVLFLKSEFLKKYPDIINQ